MTRCSQLDVVFLTGKKETNDRATADDGTTREASDGTVWEAVFEVDLFETCSWR